MRLRAPGAPNYESGHRKLVRGAALNVTSGLLTYSILPFHCDDMRLRFLRSYSIVVGSSRALHPDTNNKSMRERRVALQSQHLCTSDLFAFTELT